MSYIELSEDYKKIIRKECPYATDEQIKIAIQEVGDEINQLVIDEIEKTALASLNKIDLPSDADSRLRYSLELSRARRSVSSIRIEREKTAVSRRRMVKEIENWRQFFTDRGDTHDAKTFSERTLKIEQASAMIQNALADTDTDLSNKIINDEQSEKRTMRRLEGMRNAGSQ